VEAQRLRIVKMEGDDIREASQKNDDSALPAFHVMLRQSGFPDRRLVSAEAQHARSETNAGV